MGIDPSSQVTGKTELPPPEQVFPWAHEAMRERNWPESGATLGSIASGLPATGGTWIQGAVAHMEAGQIEAAAALLSHARQQFPNNPNALTQSAELAIRQQQWDLAETLLQQARARFPGDMEAWLKSSDCAEHRDDQELALAYNESAARTISRITRAPFVQHAEMAMRAEQWETALTRWETVRSRFPSLPRATCALPRPQPA